MKQILLDNAYEAWAKAIYYHNEIENGLSFFSNKKGFVSSLHNAVELFMKQIMIDNNDYTVANVRKPYSKEKMQLMKAYLNAENLNAFFEKIDTSSFESIDYNQLFERRYEILAILEENKSLITEGLKTLKKLRNDGVHFYINPKNYLVEKDFCLLHNFMIIFFEHIFNKGLFKKQPWRFQQEPKESLFDFQKELAFTKCALKTFSYEKALKHNTIVIAIANYINNNTDLVSCAYSLRESFYELGWYIKRYSKVRDLDNANTNYKILLLLEEYGAIKKDNKSEVEYNHYNDDAETIELTVLHVQL